MPKIYKRNFYDHIQNFIDYCTIKNLSPKTIKSYYQTLTLFAKYLEEEKNITNVEKVNKKVVEEYMAFTKDRGKYSYIANIETLKQNYQQNRKDVGKEISISTLNNYLRNIKVFFNWLCEHNLIKYNDVHETKFIKSKRKEKEQLTDEEFKKLIKSLDITKFSEYRDFIVIQLIFDTGMRIGECLSLTFHEVDFNRKSIFLGSNITKSKQDRYVFFSNKMSGYFRRYIKFKDAIKNTELLFPTTRNTKLSIPNFEKNFRGYISRAKINKNITPHSLRNNFARRFLINGGDIFMLSKILGHSSVTITEQAYLDVNTEDIRKSYLRFSPLENINRF